MGDELGGPSRGKAMMNGQGISLILKSIELRFRRPVTYPDTVSNFNQDFTLNARLYFDLHRCSC